MQLCPQFILGLSFFPLFLSFPHSLSGSLSLSPLYFPPISPLSNSLTLYFLPPSRTLSLSHTVTLSLSHSLFLSFTHYFSLLLSPHCCQQREHFQCHCKTLNTQCPNYKSTDILALCSLFAELLNMFYRSYLQQSFLFPFRLFLIILIRIISYEVNLSVNLNQRNC